MVGCGVGVGVNNSESRAGVPVDVEGARAAEGVRNQQTRRPAQIKLNSVGCE